MIAQHKRSTDPDDYQDLPQAIGVMAKSFVDGFVIPLHSHERDQLLYGISGIMHLRTEGEAWIVPPDGAVYIPAGTDHSINMHGD
ncbi:MAG: cupin domain-containing protein, partial [Rhodospirillaceae bacterium]|nr:cupin domain-containing protein [Rhodospirillaceae bacterium]